MITCSNCFQNYYGETRHYSHKRIHQHSNHNRKGNSIHSPLCQHANKEGHIFHFNNYNIIPTLCKVIISKFSANIN